MSKKFLWHPRIRPADHRSRPTKMLLPQFKILATPLSMVENANILKIMVIYNWFQCFSVVWKTGGAWWHQSKSPKPVTWVTCHVIAAWQLEAERTSFPDNTDCYHGNRHRYHGYLGSHLDGNMALRPSGGGARAYSGVPLSGGGWATQLFALSLISHFWLS